MTICRLMLGLLFVMSAHAEEIIWSGEVDSNGNPTQAVSLKLHESYQIRVSGFVNLGKWVQNREKLANDACFEFSPEHDTDKILAFKNSLDISVCDGKYHPDHIYVSEPFVADQNKIHFWVFDNDYEDNTGKLQVEIIHIKKS